MSRPESYKEWSLELDLDTISQKAFVYWKLDFLKCQITYWLYIFDHWLPTDPVFRHDKYVSFPTDFSFHP